MEPWLRTEVIPVLDELNADSTQVVTDEQLADTLLAEHSKHIRKGAKR